MRNIYAFLWAITLVVVVWSVYFIKSNEKIERYSAQAVNNGIIRIDSLTGEILAYGVGNDGNHKTIKIFDK